ncbi:hypothetical protein KAR91_35645 [Candidatus Pacearchaeota archaeon]|nr:hypothetical protein [Candidatus Pacearchaeota archaeon]
MRLTDELREEYQELWETCELIPHSYLSTIIAKIKAHQNNYTLVQQETSVPWQVIAAIHNMEGSLKFHTHLHNGDSLQRRTTHVPKNRPVEGKPPFTWVDSAIDALMYDSLDVWDDWSISGTLFMLEKYNGFGYRKYHPGHLSPYLWSSTGHATPGRYVADGKWNATSKSERVGAVMILKTLGMFEDVPTEVTHTRPDVAIEDDIYEY